MKKNAFFVLVLFLLTVSGLSIGKVDALGGGTDPNGSPIDEGGDGYNSTDTCGYLYGTGTVYSGGTLELSGVSNKAQGCIDSSGYFYENAGYILPRTSTGSFTVASVVTNTYTIDFAANNGTSSAVVVDTTSGSWSGHATIIASTGSMPAKTDVWFDWVCSNPKIKSCLTPSLYTVRTDVDTGDVAGYAWNDSLGFISFNGLHQELPPKQVDMVVDVTSSEESGSMAPSAADYTNAPLADGQDYWSVNVHLYWSGTTDSLTAADVTSLSISPNRDAGTQIFLDQVKDTGNAIVESASTKALTECATSSGSCVQTETGGDTVWRTFVKSSSPTSAMLGLDTDTDTGIEFYSDRAGCRTIYYDQWHYVDGTSSAQCPTGTSSSYSKGDVFYDRVNDRNQYLLKGIDVDVDFADANASVLLTSSQSQDSSTGVITHSFSSPYDLPFRPRFMINNFSSNYDGTTHDDVSSVIAQDDMTLDVNATVYNTSAAYQAANTGMGSKRPAYDVFYQLDSTSDPRIAGSTPQLSDLTLLIDTSDADTVADCTRRTDSKSIGAGASGTSYEYDVSYTMSYGQKTCDGGTGGAYTNTLSDPQPTAEQWVCDYLAAAAAGFGGTSCYYTAYLPRIDRHLEPENMLVIGAINSTITLNSLLDNGDTLSMLGSTNTIKLRNKMYAQIIRALGGQTPSNSTVTLTGSTSFSDSSGAALSFMNDTLLVTGGDLIVNGSDTYAGHQTAVTVGGNAYIMGSVGSDTAGGRFGVIALKDSDGNGGNIYFGPDATTLYANFFADGAGLPWDGDLSSLPAGEVDWTTLGGDEARYTTLKNQLYLNGSFVGHNTVGVTAGTGTDGSGDLYSSIWQMGDGLTGLFAEAREHDLNDLRQYRRCYVLDTDGRLTSTVTDCGEGETLSTSQTATDLATAGSYPPLILEYSPADELPIFRAEVGLFQ